MSGKPTSPVTKTDETVSKSKTISQMVPGSLNKYNTLNNHIIMNVGTFDKFTDVVSEVIYRNTEPTQLAGMNGPFQGIVLQVIAADPAQRITSMLFGRELKLLKLKVRIPELHVSLPIPSKEEMEAVKNNTLRTNSTIEFYPIFTAQDEEVSKKIPNVGDIVWVTFKNIEQQSGGIYLGTVAGATSIGVQSSSGGVMGAIIEGAAKATSNANGEIGAFNYVSIKKKLEKQMSRSNDRGHLLYAAGSGSPMVIGIQSALGQPVTGVLDSVTLEAMKNLRNDGYVGAGELIKFFGEKFPIFLRMAEYTQNNESGGHRELPGKAINYWSGRTTTGERNVVYNDGAGMNYGILGYQISHWGTKKRSAQPYANHLFEVKASEINGVKRPALMIQNWKLVKPSLAVYDEGIRGGSSLAKLMIEYGGTTGKTAWDNNRLELYAQRAIAGQIQSAWSIIKKSSYSAAEKESLYNHLIAVLDKEIYPISEVSAWMLSPDGVKAQIYYYCESLFFKAVRFAINHDWTVPVLTAAADITAGGPPAGKSGVGYNAAIKGKSGKERDMAWVKYVDGSNPYSDKKSGRHEAPIMGMGRFAGNPIYMNEYGLTDEYTNKPAVKAEMKFWYDYYIARTKMPNGKPAYGAALDTAHIKARKMLKTYLSNLFGWDLGYIKDEYKYGDE